MPIHGVDVSRYQGLESLDGQSFVIVNVEDPTLADKVADAKALGIPWGLYTWIYPGNGRADMSRALAKGVQFGEPPMGFWLDYEQAGVTIGDLEAALDCAADFGALDRTGVYTFLYELNRDPSLRAAMRDRPLWLAYYPGNNDGSYPASQIGDARNWNAVMWQYTSGANAPVGLDRNVVIDEAWYSTWVGAPAGGDDFDMTDDELRGNVYATLKAFFDGGAGVEPGAVPFGYTTWKESYIDLANKVRGMADPTALATAIASKLDVAGVTKEQIEDAVREVFADAATGP